MGENVPLIARAVGGRIMGPRPGRAICTFWQGIVEILLRIVAIVFSTFALISMSIALSDKNAPRDNETRAAGGFVVGVAFFTVVIEIGFTVARLLNVGLLNYQIKWFLLVDCALAGILGMLFLAGMILSAITVHNLKKKNNYDKTSADSFSAAAVMSFGAMVTLAGLGVWSLLFMLNKWNKHVVVYTLKDAVLG